jgi:hypothetical protein
VSVETLEIIDRRVAARLAGRLAGKIQGGAPLWPVRVVSWMDLVDLCRELDDEIVQSETTSADTLALHGAVLALAIGCGEWLIHEIQVEHADLSASGQTLDTAKASLELLRIIHRSRHPDFASEEIESVRLRIFNAAA